jgi:hypothetical protein
MPYIYMCTIIIGPLFLPENNFPIRQVIRKFLQVPE